MSLNRYAKKRDTAEPAIVQALEQAGFEVWILDKPVDVAVRKSGWPPGMVQLMEIKTPGGRGVRRSQKAQAAFLASTGTPVVKTPIEALRALGVLQEHVL